MTGRKRAVEEVRHRVGTEERVRENLRNSRNL
jgi:hypothetical protein